MIIVFKWWFHVGIWLCGASGQRCLLFEPFALRTILGTVIRLSTPLGQLFITDFPFCNVGHPGRSTQARRLWSRTTCPRLDGSNALISHKECLPPQYRTKWCDRYIFCERQISRLFLDGSLLFSLPWLSLVVEFKLSKSDGWCAGMYSKNPFFWCIYDSANAYNLPQGPRCHERLRCLDDPVDPWKRR